MCQSGIQFSVVPCAFRLDLHCFIVVYICCCFGASIAWPRTERVQMQTQHTILQHRNIYCWNSNCICRRFAVTTMRDSVFGGVRLCAWGPQLLLPLFFFIPVTFTRSHAAYFNWVIEKNKHDYDPPKNNGTPESF